MAEEDVATKAPESDAQEDIIPGDTPAQTGPTMGEHCTSDRPTPTGLTPKGELRKLGGVDIYLSKPESYPTNPSKLLLLLSSGTGVKSTNNQIQADKFADEGFVVVMPDLFDGNPAPNSSLASEAEAQGTSFLDKIKLKAAEIAKSFVIDEWLARHTEEKVLPILEKVIDACKSEFADAVGNGGGIYAVGYCFGGRYVLLLASERSQVQTGWSGAQKPSDEEAGEGATPTKGPYIKAGALAHATLVSPDDFQGLKVPVSLVCVESDPMFPDEVRETGENIMSKENVEHEVQVYPGVPHGFAVIGDYNDGNIKSAQETAFDQMLRWIKEH
ncbi:alpha/beta-hydrolase [Annulohypoxylon maeteangense]|uniref:alpha/beta-hydrolase n=1 Tax=Annulohypoxylon maeteangense TaxID=1927788 RepID=UPI0020080E3A|nr:alpha/beta-hydrolase [Annulohypoxylon maeteangense]KAI0885656.1 alpha/beta-hydrolase [Annulohypoxylon maeteangense]